MGCCLLLLPARAGVQLGWGPTTALGPSLPGAPAVAVDRFGNIVAAWVASTPSGRVVRARRHSANAAVWSEPVDLSAPQGLYSGVNGPVAVVTDAAGNAVAAWIQRDRPPGSPPEDSIHAARYGFAMDGWSAPVGLITYAPAAGLAYGGASLRLAADPGGPVFVVWSLGYRFVTGGSVGVSTARAARYDPETGTVIELHPLATTVVLPASIVEPDVVVDASGNATMLWPASAGPGSEVMRSSEYAAAAGSWSAPVDVLAFPDQSRAYSVRTGIDALGNITAVWP